MVERTQNNWNSHTYLRVGGKMTQLLGKTVWRFLIKLNIHLPHAPGILVLGIYLKEMKTNVHIQLSMNTYSRFIHDSHKLETIQTSMNRWMGRQIIIHPHSGIPLPSERGWIIPNTPRWVKDARRIREPPQGPHLCETPETMNLI